MPEAIRASELLALHPRLNVALRLCLWDTGAALDHGDELSLVLDRRQVVVGQEAPSLPGLLSVALLAGQRVGSLAALEPEHDDVLLWRARAEGGEDGREGLAPQNAFSETLSPSSTGSNERSLQWQRGTHPRFIYF